MNYLKMFGAFVIFALMIFLIWHYIKHRQCGRYSRPSNLIRKSTIRNGGFGVFAVKDYSPGDVVETCLLVKEKKSSNVLDSSIGDYMFSDSRGEYTSMGSCAVINSHEKDPDVKWKIKGRRLTMRAVKSIPAGKEVFTTYGPRYWKTRGIKPVLPPTQPSKPQSESNFSVDSSEN